MENELFLSKKVSLPESLSIVMNDEPDQPHTATADEDIVDLVQKWGDEKRRLVLVTAGRTGVGKSTLINNLLGLKGKEAAMWTARSVTIAVYFYEEEKYGILVCIIDTPGLESGDLTSEQEQEALARLTSYGKPDLLLYCISLTDRFQKYDDRIVETLTETFGTEEDRGEIWRRAILVLTFGDVVLQGDEKEKRELLQIYTDNFERALKKAKVSDVSVKYMLSTKDINIEQDLGSALAKPVIVGVPVGWSIETPNPKDWVFLLFTEVIKRCRMDAIPALLGVGAVGGTVAGAAATGRGGIWGAVTGGFWGAVTGALGSIFGRTNETFELTVLAMIIEARLKAEQQKEETKVKEQQKEETKVKEQQKEEMKVEELELKRAAEELQRQLEKLQKKIKELEEAKRKEKPVKN